MDLFQSMQISASSLAVQRLRMNLIASNLANINTTKTPQGGPYRRKDIAIRPVGMQEMGGAQGAAPSNASFSSELDRHLQGVEVTQVVEDKSPPRMVYKPSHPDANASGYVAMPNINMITEMVSMMNAQRSYEASVTAVNASRAMVTKSLSIGR
jgi:flagellar basal-body rod protein FlgC